MLSARVRALINSNGINSSKAKREGKSFDHVNTVAYKIHSPIQ